jgi:dephospho-CoA kinase
VICAVTGGIGEGKSTVLELIRQSGFAVVSADTIAAQLFDEPDINRALAGLVSMPPPVDRQSLREALVANPALRRSINRLMHPLIMDRIRRSEADFVEVPLLLEACLQAEFDQVWLVTCGPEEQLRRVAERYGDETKARAIIGTQLPSSIKAVYADRIIDTRQSLLDVKESVNSALVSR